MLCCVGTVVVNTVTCAMFEVLQYIVFLLVSFDYSQVFCQLISPCVYCIQPLCHLFFVRRSLLLSQFSVFLCSWFFFFLLFFLMSYLTPLTVRSSSLAAITSIYLHVTVTLLPFSTFFSPGFATNTTLFIMWGRKRQEDAEHYNLKKRCWIYMVYIHWFHVNQLSKTNNLFTKLQHH